MNTLSATIKKRRKELGYTLAQIAKAVVLRVPPPALMGWNIDGTDAAVVTVNEPYFAPIVGTIPAGYPAVALEDIEGYEPIPYPNTEDYIFLRVSGDSMINADIRPGDLVLIHRQTTAEPGQIVACRVNGDEATLKRYRPAADGVYLMPENSNYAPRRVDYADFESGYAGIIGVATEIRRKV